MAGAHQKKGALYRTLASYLLLRRKAEKKDAPSREVMASLSLQGVTLKPDSCDKVLDEIFQAIGPEG